MNYDANSIQQLTFREGVRKRVGIYLGSADNSGVIAGLLELVNNATDEALVCPTANKIEITVGPDWASCLDAGRGMPHGSNAFAKEVMINLLTENHSGAKFDDNAYGGKSRGLNGTGSAATCCSSDIFKISSYRDGYEWYMEFEKGKPKFPECQKKPLNGHPNGTYIWYKPSQEVFNADTVHFDYDEICSIIEEYSYFNKKIRFIVINAETQERNEYYSARGLADFADKKIQKPLHKNPITFSTSENGIDIEIIAQWTTGKERFYLFSNGGENPNGGTPITGIKTALTTFFKKYIDTSDSDLVRRGLVYICSVNLKNPIYDGQTKTKITNPELRGLAQRSMGQALNDFKDKNPNEFEQIINFFKRYAKADAAAEKAREAILNHEKKEATSRRKKVLMPEKFKDCEKHGENSTLIITEGNSALAGLNPARNVETDALYAVRGKIKNLLKHPVEECLENQEVSDIITLLGCGIMDKYNSKKLNYGKVAIASDGDIDGLNIMCLVATLFMVLIPDFVKEGRLCWLRAPLYRIGVGNKRYYAYNDEELKNYQSQFPKAEVGRYKGLGEMRPEDVEESMFHTENQHLECLTIDDFEQTYQTLVMLMGKEVSPRRDYLFENVDFSVLNN
jgi:DNA gyrase subunit B